MPSICIGITLDGILAEVISSGGPFLLLEDGSKLLLEDGSSRMLL